MQLSFKSVYAATDPTAFGKVIDPIIFNIIYPLIGLMFAVAIVVFVYGVVEMIAKAGDAEGRATGRRAMWGGIIGMFIMVSAWGIINIVANTIKSAL